MARKSRQRLGRFFLRVFLQEGINPLTYKRERDQAVAVFDQWLAFEDELRHRLAHLKRRSGRLLLEQLSQRADGDECS